MTIPATLNGLHIRRRLGPKEWTAPTQFGPDGWLFNNRLGPLRIIITVSDYDGHDWIHASIAHRHQMPTYDDLKTLHHAAFNHTWAYQVFAPPTHHVNQYEFALHLWGRADGTNVLPDFTEGTGLI